ncbi:MAG: FKBP-type peptidyl-prolyl cis-trans isomerase [Vicingaceae bacterium]
MYKNLKVNMKVVLITVILLQLLQCQQKKEQQKELPFQSKKEYEAEMIETHRAFLKRENALIESYIDNSGKDFVRTGTGLRYHIYKHANGDSLKSGDVAVIQYKLSLINGELLYETGTERSQHFAVDFDDVESGLHEGVKKLSVGDKALLILPAHLGHGITGDQAAIPSQSTLVYDLHLLAKK